MMKKGTYKFLSAIVVSRVSAHPLWDKLPVSAATAGHVCVALMPKLATLTLINELSTHVKTLLLEMNGDRQISWVPSFKIEFFFH
jgi:hypothetical protein